MCVCVSMYVCVCVSEWVVVSEVSAWCCATCWVPNVFYLSYSITNKDLKVGYWYIYTCYIKEGAEKPLPRPGLQSFRGKFVSPLVILSGKFAILSWESVVLICWAWRGVINKMPELLKWNLCFACSVDADQLELRNLWWLRRDQHPWGKTCGKCFLRVSTCKLCSEVAKAVPCAGSHIWSYVRLFLKAQQGHGEHLRLGTVRAQERLLVKMHPSCSRRPQDYGEASTMGWPPWKAAAVEWNRPEPRKQAVCAVEGGARVVTQALWRSPETHQWIPDVGHRRNYVLGVRFVLIVTVPWLFSLGIRKYLTYLFML